MYTSSRTIFNRSPYVGSRSLRHRFALAAPSVSRRPDYDDLEGPVRTWPRAVRDGDCLVKRTRVRNQYANEIAWREDHRRVCNGINFRFVTAAALHHPKSEVEAGYWRSGAPRDRSTEAECQHGAYYALFVCHRLRATLNSHRPMPTRRSDEGSGTLSARPTSSRFI